MGWLGLDDTDSLKGGCTTEVLFQLLEDLPDTVTFRNPRLVRLWPFAKQRTRGNAAVAVELITENETELLTHLDLWWEEHIVSLKGEVGTSDHSERTQYPADPGMIWSSELIVNEAFYKSAVSSHIELQDLPEVTRYWGGNGRIGATAAVLWPANQCTYEAIAWRDNEAEGRRQLDDEALTEVEDLKDTFLCRNPKLGTSLLAPRGNSPVLFGIRSWTKEGAQQALEILEARRNIDVDSRMRRWPVAYPISIGTVHSGDWASTVPDLLVAEGRFGVALGEDIESARSIFEACIRDACARDLWLAENPVEIEWWGGQFASGQTEPHSDLIKNLQKAHLLVVGAPLEEYGAPYGSDLRLLTGLAGIPTLQYGPGDVSIAHAPDEYVHTRELETTARVIAQVIRDSIG